MDDSGDSEQLKQRKSGITSNFRTLRSLSMRALLIIAVLLVLIVSLISVRNLKQVDVKSETVKRQSLTMSVTATSTGTIKSDNEAKITAQRAGRLEKLTVDEGDHVKSGGVVAEIDKEEAYYNLQMAEASLRKAEFILNQLISNHNSFKVDVEKNIERAKATFLEVESRLKRFTGLKEKEYVSEMDMEAVQKEYDVAKANLGSAIAARDQVKARAEELKAQEANIKEANNHLAISKLNSQYSFITSPISGIVTSRPVRLGEGVTKGSVIATVVSTDSLYIEAFIDEADVAKAKTGQKVNIIMDAYPERVFTGEVYRISPVVLGGKQETRTFEVRTRFKDIPPVIKPGMSADIEIIVESIENALVIPSQSLFEKEGRKFVYIVRDSRARLVRIEIGRFNWNFTEVKSGIKEGDEVVVNTGAAELKDGIRVRMR